MLRILSLSLFMALASIAVAQQQLKIKVIFTDSSFDDASKAKLYQAVALLDSVYNSKAFGELVLAENFNVGNHNLSSADILELVRSGMDNYKGALKDYSMDLRLNVYDFYKGGKEYGNTKMKSRITSTHRCYILKNDFTCYATHLAHEYMHEIGFYDVKSWDGIKRIKTNSVPYKIGRIVTKIINKPNKCSYQTTTCKKIKP